MKSFQIYGIGNALVDIDLEVSEATIQRLNITKGVMTLIDATTHQSLLAELHGIEHLRACGGSAANTLFTAQQMGAKTFYSCKIGDDEAGDFFYHNLVAYGVETNANDVERKGVTGNCIVLVTPDADRTMNTYLGVTAEFSKDEICEHALKRADYLYIEGYLVATDKGREAAILARQLAQQHGTKIAMSLSDPNMVTYFKSGLCDIMDQSVEVLFCNESEALLFTETHDLQSAKEKLKKYARTFVITLGERGALVYDGNDFFLVNAYEANVIDTVGAGDVFAGIFLFALTHGHSYRDATELANYAAAKVVAKFGPRLSQSEINDVQRLLAEPQRVALA